MHLERLEIQGFKTFAKKTLLTFLPPKEDRCPLTAIVGPNGSGKSNTADAIRWVLGEQSLKLLRGKQSDDVIFSGSEGKGRSGFAEVSITLNNEDHTMPIDYQRVVITRRLFRDGTSEYVLNEANVRLADIQLLLAQANIGQRSYSVVGQGMIDHILVASPEERKTFFDDATGVKQFQIKRHEAMLKFKRTLENLADVEMVIKEIEPRMRSLKRQVARLEQRDEVERDLRAQEKIYYGSQWWKLVDQRKETDIRLAEVEKKIDTVRVEVTILEEKTTIVETEDTKDEGLVALQKTYREHQRSRDEIRRKHFETEKGIELAKVKAQSNWSPLPLSKIIEEVEALKKKLEQVKSLSSLEEILKEIDVAFSHSQTLVSRLQRPNPEDIKPDPTLLAEMARLKEEEKELDKHLKQLEHEIDSHAAKEKQVRSDLIDTQRALRAKQQDLHTLEQEKNRHDIERARLEERTQALQKEMDEFMKQEAMAVRETRVHISGSLEDTYAEIQRLRYKLELIGGIDPEIVQEYEETKQRFDFLEGQMDDLQKAIKSTEKIIKELDEQIENQSKKVFGDINKRFQHYFKILFSGGTCELVRVTAPITPADTATQPVELEEKTPESIPRSHTMDIGQKEGIEIYATPPGKRLKSLNLLSGGERALTSIALLSAIMDVNPSPFVVLDEVDAALDESNTVRFASILDELAQKSQFIIITHNRATMEKADILYGVTMGDNGISNLLSVHLEEIAQGGTARR